MHVARSSFARTPLIAALIAALVGLTVVVPPSAPAAAQTPTFSDIPRDNVHREAIALIVEDGIASGYPDGTYRPRLDVRRDQMATFLSNALRLQRQTSDFPDVPSESVHDGAIGAIGAIGITSGFPDGTYRPANTVTRGQLATFLTKALNLPRGNATFPDVPSDYVHADAIASVVSAGIAGGFPDGTYRPNGPVKRDQMATFLANGLDLPREPEEPEEPENACPGTDGVTTSSTGSPSEGDPEASRASEDAEESDGPTEAGVTVSTMSDPTTAAESDREVLGPAIPGESFPLTSVLRTSPSTLEVHTQDLATSRGARVAEDGSITATTTIPVGTRTWATATLGDDVYVGQWRVAEGRTNLYRYDGAATGGDDRRATGVAAIPTGPGPSSGEFWALAADEDAGWLWAGTRAHASSDFRAKVGLGNGRDDGRHVIHRVDPSSGEVTNVLVCLPEPPSNSSGVRPDVKQLAVADGTVYLGLGQQLGGARVYAFEPGDRTEIPLEDVRDLTPFNVEGANGIFAMAVSDRWVAFGSQASSAIEPRLIVVDRASEAVRANIPLPNASRVDAIALDGDRVAATTFAAPRDLPGNVFETPIPPDRVQRSIPASGQFEDPVPDQFHRYVEFTAEGLRGVSSRGVVWTIRRSDGDVEQVNLINEGAPVAPGLPHSLHVGDEEVITGASSAVTFRSLDDPRAVRTLAISGEVKAATTAPTGDAYLTTYPNARLWKVAAGDDQAEVLRRWDADFSRPADVDHDVRTGQVLVVARNDNNPRSEARETGSSFGFRASRLFSVVVDEPSEQVVPGFALTRPTSDGTTPVEASAVLAGDTPSGSEAFVGDTRGGVQRIDAGTGQRTWYREARSEDRDRRVVDLHLADDGLVVTSTGSLSGVDDSARTLIRVLDPRSGEELERTVVSTTFNIGDAVVTGDLVVMPSNRRTLRWYDRAAGELLTTTTFPTNASFGGPYLGLDRDACRIYNLEGTPSQLVRFAPVVGGCEFVSEARETGADEGDTASG